MDERKITLVLLLLGKYELQLRELDKRLNDLTHLTEMKNISIVVAADSQQWDTVPAIQMFQLQHRDILFLFLENHCLPAVVMNAALDQVKTHYVVFALLGDPILKRIDQFSRAIELENKTQADEIAESMIQTHACADVAYFIGPAPDKLNRDVFAPSLENLFGWSMAAEKSCCMGSFCTPTLWIRSAGGFDESPLLQEEIERWYAMLVAGSGTVRLAYSERIYVKRLREYPLYKNYQTFPRDLAVRYATYCRGSATAQRSPILCATQFANDLRGEDASLYCQLTGINSSIPIGSGKRYRILIVGGFWEYHHNQICFFNYLEKLYGSGFATFRTVFEYNLQPNTVLNYDLVIFTRCRSKNILKIAKLCEEFHIATLYMIDDNWISIAKDHPEQGAMFVPGNEMFDNFIEALRLCKTTWLFSDILRQDVAPYARCIKKFKISVDSELFYAKNSRPRTSELLYVGFSGSLRYDNTAFIAMARYAKSHPNIVVVLVGVLSEEQEALFDGVKTVRIPFCSYKSYAAAIAAIAPDLLIAPLQHTRTMESKCYNKYVESAISGSACIFSKCHPYIDVVEEGVNGFFVEDETTEGWYRKLDDVLGDIKKLREVQHNAYEDVICNHTVEVLLQEFCSKISEVIEKETLTDD